MKKVSVIVPVYNVEKYLERCLNSLVNQTLQDIQIIVVNDGSPDNSQEIIDRFEKEYPDKLKGYIKENGGLSDARNYGMQFVEGEYVAFVDSDDYVDETMYEKLYNKAIEEDSELVVCGYYKVNDATYTMTRAQYGNMDEYGKSASENPMLIEMSAPYAWNKLVKWDLLKRSGVQFPKGYIYEDIPTMYLLIAMANRVSKVDEQLYYYIVERKDSITATFNKSKVLIMKSLDLFNQRFKDAGLFDEFRDRLVVITLRHTYFRFIEFDRFDDRKMKKKLVKEGFGVLNKYFPDWKKNSGTYQRFGLPLDRNVKRWFYKKKAYWWFVARMPYTWVVKFKEWDQKHYRRGGELRYEYVKYFENDKVVNNRVLIESFHGKNISDSPYAIMKEILARHKKYEIYCTTTASNYKLNKKFIKANKLNVKLVKLSSRKYYKVLATAKYLINNVSFPLWFIRKDEQVYLNTWHGTPLKTLGKNMKKGIESMNNIQHNFLQASHLLFPNEYTKEHMMEDYNLDKLYTGKTVVGGYPRNCIFSDKEAGVEVKKKLGLEGKTVYAYMPTWRGANSYKIAKSDMFTKILKRFDEVLDENHVMFVNLHPNTKEDIDYNEFKYIKPFPNDVPNYEFINSTDALITDYSSIFFDYSITGKPIILFAFDYDEYMDERGMYLDIKDLPFELVYDIDKLCNIIKNDEIFSQDYSKNKDYFDKILKRESIDATKNILDCIMTGSTKGVDIEDYGFNKDIERKVCVQLERIDTKEEYDKFIEENNGENVVFAIRDVYFHTLMNEWFFEEYNKKVTYFIYKYCKFITREEDEIWKTTDKEHKPQRREIKKKVRAYAFRRSLPNLKITNKKDIKRVI